MNLLFIGDIFGEAGRVAVERLLPEVKRRHRIEFVVANGENISHGRGITAKTADFLFAHGVNVITTGNHAFDHSDSLNYFQGQPRLLRPANYPKQSPGRGWVLQDVYQGVRIAVINLIGRVHMEPANCPFHEVDQILQEVRGQADIVFVDMHAEATSEKRAMGWHLDGRVAAVLGSHTHVPTADEEILPKGTAFLTDAGMTGPYRSVIGMKIPAVLEKLKTGVKTRYEPATEDVRMYAVIVSIEESTGLANNIQRICEKL